MNANKSNPVFKKGDVVYTSTWSDLPGRSKGVCFYDRQTFDGLKRKKFWNEIRGLIDANASSGEWNFVLKDGSNLKIVAREFAAEGSNCVVAKEVPQAVRESERKAVDLRTNDDGRTKTAVNYESTIESLLPGYERFTINSRSFLDGRTNFPTAMKLVDGHVSYGKTMSDSSVPFNYLLNSPAANAVRKVVVFKDANGDPCRTIVLFDNGDRVVVRRSPEDAPDLRASILWAIVKHSFGKSVDRQVDRIVETVTVDSERNSEMVRGREKARRDKAKMRKSVRIDG